MKPSIIINQLSFCYEELPVLQDVNLTISKGDFLAVIGPNGGGKSTLLKLMMGLLKPNKGKITLFGKSPEEMRKKIGYVPQCNKADRMFPITTYEILLTGAVSKSKFMGIYPKEIHAKAEELLELFTLTSHKDKAFGALSGGLAQKTLLARALICDPEIIFLDEPMSNIDAATKEEIFSFLFNFKKKKTILMVTHDLQVAVEKVSRFICIEQKATMMLPKDVCEHFALGLYHTPLQDHE